MRRPKGRVPDGRVFDIRDIKADTRYLHPDYEYLAGDGSLADNDRLAPEPDLANRRGDDLGRLVDVEDASACLAKNPPSATSRFSMICASPGAQTRCSTASLRSSQTLAASGFLSLPISMGITRALTAIEVHASPVARWM